MNKIQISCVSALLLATSMIGCGDSSSRPDPAAPTAVENYTAQVSNIGSASATGVDFLQRVVRDTATITTWTSQNRWRPAADGLTVQGTDVITAVTGTCPNVAITVRGAAVTVNTSTVFGTGLTCAGLTVGTTVHVTGMLTFGTGGTFSVVATTLNLETTPTTNDEVAGTVASVTGTCPTRTMTLLGAGGVVVTSATTTFDSSDGCTSIAAGAVIEAHGTRNTSGQLLATTIEVDEQESSHGKKVSGEGTVGHLAGTCPALSMVVRGVHVSTSAATTFENGDCGNVREGTKVVVTGETQTDGSVIALVVRITDQPGGGGHDRVEGEGTVASVKGACPNITMLIEGQSVMTSASTVFTAGACSDLRAGTKVSVRGTNQGNSLMAESIAILHTKGH